MRMKNVVMGIGIALGVFGLIDIALVMAWLGQYANIAILDRYGMLIPMVIGFICLGIGTFLVIWSREKRPA
jgi:hypothetical protein